jgi:hypothetical protein
MGNRRVTGWIVEDIRVNLIHLRKSCMGIGPA